MSKATGLRNDATAIWTSGLDSVRADRLVRRAVSVRGETLRIGERIVPLGGVRKLAVVGAGKAGAAMARGLAEALGPRVLTALAVEGWVNVPAFQGGAVGSIVLHPARSGHDNRPAAAGILGSERMLALAGSLGPRDLLVCLLSGGGSALWPAPAEGVSLADKQAVTDLLLSSGAAIGEMNAVRKHLSRVKGGGLVSATRARVATLLVSDVIGNRLDVIASGPTAPDPTTYADALLVLDKYGLAERVPGSVLRHLREGAAGRFPETLKRSSSRVTHAVLGSNQAALDAAAREARRRGYRVLVLSSRLEGESRALGFTLADLAQSVREDGTPIAPPACLLSGGETTVVLGPDAGKGGRNQELVLAALLRLGVEGLRDTVILSGGTDGEDGPTDAAGAVADSRLAQAAAARALDPARHLDRHDAYPFFAALDGLLRTGPTGTNVMDLRVLLVGRPRPGRRPARVRASTPTPPERSRSRRGRGKAPTRSREAPASGRTRATRPGARRARSSR
jgi:hydroxypyruvate reductase/glycerate 2-kinase